MTLDKQVKGPSPALGADRLPVAGRLPSVMVFTRDLRIHDNPALTAAWRESAPPVTLFVLDDGLLNMSQSPTNRLQFLADSLRDLDHSLRTLGGQLLVRRGDWTIEVLAAAAEVGASTIHVSNDHSFFASGRLQRLELSAREHGLHVHRHAGVSVVPPEVLQPTGGGGYKVFTPFFRRWSRAGWRAIEPPPPPLRNSAPRIGSSQVPGVAELLDALIIPTAGSSMNGGEAAGRQRLFEWLDQGLETYETARDRPGDDQTSRLSPYLHFGCLSPLEVAVATAEHPEGGGFLRQLAWRDFFLQVLAHRPDASWRDFRHRGDRWDQDPEAFRVWAEGLTGYPLVDAGMRQLVNEGFMHNRLRMVTASFLVKDLYLDWRLGAKHFMEHLVDGDVASNQLGWQWVAGTGTDANPHRVLNPIRQSERFDPEGAYIRRWLPELATVTGSVVHDPPDDLRRACSYPSKIVDHHEAIARFQALRAS